jgi:hypothetical protein
MGQKKTLFMFFSFDTTDDDEDVRKDDPAPLIPTPVGFTPDCSVLDNASILFLNTNILLELRKEWRFLYSTRTHSRSFSDLIDAIEFQGDNQRDFFYFNTGPIWFSDPHLNTRRVHLDSLYFR